MEALASASAERGDGVLGEEGFSTMCECSCRLCRARAHMPRLTNRAYIHICITTRQPGIWFVSETKEWCVLLQVGLGECCSKHRGRQIQRYPRYLSTLALYSLQLLLRPIAQQGVGGVKTLVLLVEQGSNGTMMGRESEDKTQYSYVLFSLFSHSPRHLLSRSSSL